MRYPKGVTEKVDVVRSTLSTRIQNAHSIKNIYYIQRVYTGRS